MVIASGNSAPAVLVDLKGSAPRIESPPTARITDIVTMRDSKDPSFDLLKH
jgi:hypothetical protein